MEYKILRHTRANDLEGLVEDHLVEGWELQGGVSVYVEPEADLVYRYTFVQAMVRNGQNG